MKQPNFHLIAGPNGAGKTTFAREFLPRAARTAVFLNPDLIAAGLSPLDPAAAAVRAGRLLIEEFDRLAAARQDFATETTLSGTWLVERLKRLRGSGYRLRLYFLWLRSPQTAVDRVAERVRAGGHDVPGEAVVRRYASGLASLREIYAPLFDVVRFFDHSRSPGELVAIRRGKRLNVRDLDRYNLIMGTRT